MPTATTAGRLALEDAVPPEARGAVGELNKRGLEQLFGALAAMGPDAYRAGAKRLMDLGARATTASGGYSFGPEHMRPGPELQAVRDRLNARVGEILADPALTPEQRDAQLVRATLEHMTPLEETGYREGLAAKNPLALQVHSGAKGKSENLRSLLSGDGLYTDQNFRPIPYPVVHSFAEGLRPHEYFAGTFGARQGLVQLKLGTAQAGYLCLGGDTQVRMADGTVKSIAALRVGDVVLGADKSANTFPVRVTGTFDNGPRECFRYVFRGGKQRNETVDLVCTPCHKILGKIKGPAPGKRPTNRKGGYYGLPSSTHPEVFAVGGPPIGRVRAVPAGPSDWSGVSEPWALLAGLLTGDGSTLRNVTLACGDPTLIADVRDYLDTLGVSIQQIKGHDYEYRLSSVATSGVSRERGADGTVTAGPATVLTRKVAELGLRGKRSYEKLVPPRLLDWDKPSVCAYLAGLFATDGHVGKTVSRAGVPIVSLASTSGALLRAVRDVLAFRLGIYASPVVGQKVKGRAGSPNPNPKCRGSLMKAAYRDIYIIRIASREMVCRFDAAIRMPGVKGRKLRAAIAAMGPAPFGGDFTFTPVDRTPLGAVATYDIEVDHPDSLFVLSNGLIVSNSKRLLHAAHRLVVTDPEGPEPYDPKNPRGLPVDTMDPDNEGALLAHPAGGYPRNTVLTPEVMRAIHGTGAGRILVRSPLVGGPADGGVYGNDVGVREKGVIAPRGDYVGIAASQALCLAESTLVRMADGSTKAISAVVVGDRVLGCDLAGVVRPVSVLGVAANGPRPCETFVFRRGTGQSTRENLLEVTATPDHKIYSEIAARPRTGGHCATGHDGSTAAARPLGTDPGAHNVFCARLSVGLDDSGSRNAPAALRADLVSRTPVGALPTYDIHVDHPDHLFLLANGLVVSNSEPITQTVISSKHTGGVAGATKGQQGFPVLDRMASIPETFPGGAVHAQTDGQVGDISDAPQGGRYVTIGTERHYVRPDLELTVKRGDQVEAGDTVTDGVPNPAEFVRHKGVGEGSRLFVQAFTRAAQAAGFRPNRRNLELVTRGLINHVQLDQPTDRYSAGEILPYAAVEADYTPRDGHLVLEPKKAVGHYLERPVLHYSVGTRVTPSVAKTLTEMGVESVLAHQDRPPFSPVMVRSQATVNQDPDWLVRGLGTNVHDTLLKGVNRGDTADLSGTSYVPALAAGVDFGVKGKTVGWDPKTVAAQKPPKPPPA